jgi:hypothetical protein
MTQPTPDLHSRVDFPAGHPLHAEPLTPDQMEGVLERLERQQREHRERAHQIDMAWQSTEAQKIRDVIRADGNVDWPDFVKHVGGILEAVTMVDEYGLPDTDRIIPKVDELFHKDSEKEFQGGVTFRRHPRNRPYVAGRGTAAGEARAAAKRAAFPGDRDASEGDAEQILRQEQEYAARPRTTHPR